MPGTTESSSISKELSDLRKLTLDIKALLSSQKDILAKAKLSLPPGVSDGLSQLASALERISRVIGDQEHRLTQLQSSGRNLQRGQFVARSHYGVERSDGYYY